MVSGDTGKEDQGSGQWYQLGQEGFGGDSAQPGSVDRKVNQATGPDYPDGVSVTTITLAVDRPTQPARGRLIHRCGAVWEIG